jgi:hypothetical protein
MASRNAPQIVSSLVLNALDLFAERVKVAPVAKDRTALQRLAHQWKNLDDHDRKAVVEKIGVVTEVIAAAIPVALAATRARAARKRQKPPRKKNQTSDEDDN